MLSSFLFRGVATENELLKLKMLMIDGNERINFVEELEERCVITQQLDLKQFGIICDVLGELIEESEYDEDYDALLRIYKLSSRISTVPSHIPIQMGQITCKSSFEVRYWSNVMLWTQCVVDMVRKDMNLWAKITFIMRENHIKDTQLFGDMKSSHIRTFLVLTRIHAIVASLRSLELGNEFISSVLQEVSAQFSLANFGLEITLNSHTTAIKAFVLRVLTMAGQLFLPELAHLAKKPTNQRLQKDTVYSTIRLANGKVEFVPRIPTVSLYHEAAYCPLLELIFSIYVHAIKAHTSGNSGTGMSSPQQQTRNLDALSSTHTASAATTCICGDTIKKWAFLGTNHSIISAMTPKMNLILTAVAAGQDPRLLNSAGQVAGPPTRARSNSGRFNLQQLQNSMNLFSTQDDNNSNNNACDSTPSAGAGPGIVSVMGAQLVDRVVPHMLCERCYRHIMSHPLTLDADSIQCTGLAPLVSDIPVMPTSEVNFENILNLNDSESIRAGSRDSVYARNSAQQKHSSRQEDQGKSLLGLDFSLFDKNLSALLKKPTENQDAPPPGGKESKAEAVVRAAFVPATESTEEEVDEEDRVASITRMAQRHGLEGHRIRNSRDLTRKTRPVSLVSVASSVSSNGGDLGKLEELHIIQGSTRDVSAEAKALNDRYINRALPPEPTSSPTIAQPKTPTQAKAPVQGGTSNGGSKYESNISDNSSSAAVTPQTPTHANTSGASLLTPSPTFGSQKQHSESAKAAKPNTGQLVSFIELLWEGLNVKIVYTSKPLVEKQRVVYLRAGTEKGNKIIRERLVPIGTEASDAQRAYTHTRLLDAIANASPLQLCWGRRSVIGSVSYSPEKCLDLDTIKHIKVGSGVWKQCVNIGSNTGKTLVLKIEDDAFFNKVLEGITLLVESRKASL